MTGIPKDPGYRYPDSWGDTSWDDRQQKPAPAFLADTDPAPSSGEAAAEEGANDEYELSEPLSPSIALGADVLVTRNGVSDPGWKVSAKGEGYAVIMKPDPDKPAYRVILRIPFGSVNESEPAAEAADPPPAPVERPEMPEVIHHEDELEALLRDAENGESEKYRKDLATLVKVLSSGNLDADSRQLITGYLHAEAGISGDDTEPTLKDMIHPENISRLKDSLDKALRLKAQENQLRVEGISPQEVAAIKAAMIDAYAQTGRGKDNPREVPERLRAAIEIMLGHSQAELEAILGRVAVDPEAAADPDKTQSDDPHAAADKAAAAKTTAKAAPAKNPNVRRSNDKAATAKSIARNRAKAAARAAKEAAKPATDADPKEDAKSAKNRNKKPGKGFMAAFKAAFKVTRADRAAKRPQDTSTDPPESRGKEAPGQAVFASGDNLSQHFGAMADEDDSWNDGPKKPTIAEQRERRMHKHFEMLGTDKHEENETTGKRIKRVYQLLTESGGSATMSDRIKNVGQRGAGIFNRAHKSLDDTLDKVNELLNDNDPAVRRQALRRAILGWAAGMFAAAETVTPMTPIVAAIDPYSLRNGRRADRPPWDTEPKDPTEGQETEALRPGEVVVQREEGGQFRITEIAPGPMRNIVVTLERHLAGPNLQPEDSIVISLEQLRASLRSPDGPWRWRNAYENDPDANP